MFKTVQTPQPGISRQIKKLPVPKGTKSCFCALEKSVQTKLLVELLHAAAGVDQLLLAGVEGVALGADFHGDVLTGGAGLDDVAAGAADGGLVVLGMDAFFHCLSPHNKLS